MRFQIKKLVLWSRNPALEPRCISFGAGVNVITGASKTGKSAVIPIIDYCLGSNLCSIPVSTIRDACAWFGVVVSTDEGEMLLARREPGDQQSTGDMFLLEGPTVKVPDRIDAKNINVDAVKRVLDRLAGLSNLGFDADGSSGGFSGRPSFRDLVAFTFQPQNIVANPDVLFYKADTTKHREKLRTIFPYVLGAMTPELLAKQWEADRLDRELKQRQRELDAKSQATEKWKAELDVWVAEARDLGLVSVEEYAAATDEAQSLGLLGRAVQRPSSEARITEESVDASSVEVAALDREESKIAMDLAAVRSRMQNIQRLRSGVDEYTGALDKQRERLALSRWLQDEVKTGSCCPICGGRYDAVEADLAAMCDSLLEIEASSRQLSAVPAVFDKELVEVRDGVRQLTDRLQAIRVRRRGIEERSAALTQGRLKAAEVDRYLGRAEQALKMFAATEEDTDASSEVERLRAELSDLKAALSKSGYQARTKAALAQIATFMAQTLPQLDAERPDDPTELSIDDLTLRVVGSSGRRDSLWEIGSGANWLSYHIALTLALQRLFFELEHSPVPGFVAYDQPSQVYFPQRLARLVREGDDPELEDEDIVAVRKVFSVLSAAVARSSDELQVIVLDHAGSDVWASVDGVNLVEEWRHGNALVPLSWLT